MNTPSTDTLIKQIQSLKGEVARLQAKVDAKDPVNPTLVRVAQALRDGAEATIVYPQAGRLDGGSRVAPGSRPPAANVDRQALNAYRRLISDLERSVVLFRERMAGEPARSTAGRQEPQREWGAGPSLRCSIRACPARGKRVRAWTVVAGELVANLVCPSCESPLPNHPAADGGTGKDQAGPGSAGNA